MSSKQQLRVQLRKQRDSLTQQAVHASSARVTEKLLDMPWWRAGLRLHVYASRADWHELDTEALVTELIRQHPGMQVTVGGQDANAPVPTAHYDVIIVPVLGYDDQGYRLGLGLGWYDRFLAKQTSAYKVGLAYSWSRLGDLPHEPHDVPLDIIVTD